MRLERSIQIIGCHAEEAMGDLIVGGAVPAGRDDGRMMAETTVGDRKAITPTIRGQAGSRDPTPPASSRPIPLNEPRRAGSWRASTMTGR